MTSTTLDRQTAALEESLNSPSQASKKYFRTDVEGLRAIAVFAVVAFHASVPFFDGGFVGVDAFFVISGYLITGLLLREVLSTGRISFKNFFARRARRILPAATIVLLSVAVASILLEPLVGVYANARDLLAGAVFMSNWQFIALGTDYLAHSTADSPVLHYWSLAVEEQFYLVWPLVVLLAVMLSKRFPLKASRVVALVLGGVTVASFVLSLVLTITDPKLAYMATTTRAWEFGVGAIVAVGAHWLQSKAASPVWSRLGWLLGWGGLAALVYSTVAFDGSTPFPGTAALVPTLGTGAIIAGGLLIQSSRTAIGSFLSLRPLRYLGRLSFGWYLWHWPVLMLVEGQTGELSWPVRSLLMVVALVLAALTLHLIETPLSRWKQVAKNVAPALALGLLCIVLSTSASMAVGSSAVASLSAPPTVKLTDASFTKIFGASDSATSGAVTPSPLEAPDDVRTPKGCLLDHEKDRVRSCQLGVAGGIPVVLFGDSHAHQWAPAFEEMANERGWDLSVFAKAGCPVADLTPINDGGRYSEPECVTWRAQSIDLILTEIKPQFIVVSSLHTYISEQDNLFAAWEKSLDKLAAADVPIVYIRDTPHPLEDVPTCISGAFDDWSKCAFPSDINDDLVIQSALTGDRPNMSVIDLTPYFCDGDTCPAVRNGYLLYRDDSHITGTAALAMKPVLEESLIEAGIVPAAN
jgi:peptidoglycan/LPS O-acetylase OafA/YrhL